MPGTLGGCGADVATTVSFCFQPCFLSSLPTSLNCHSLPIDSTTPCLSLASSVVSSVMSLPCSSPPSFPQTSTYRAGFCDDETALRLGAEVAQLSLMSCSRACVMTDFMPIVCAAAALMFSNDSQLCSVDLLEAKPRTCVCCSAERRKGCIRDTWVDDSSSLGSPSGGSSSSSRSRPCRATAQPPPARPAFVGLGSLMGQDGDPLLDCWNASRWSWPCVPSRDGRECVVGPFAADHTSDASSDCQVHPLPSAGSSVSCPSVGAPAKHPLTSSSACFSQVLRSEHSVSSCEAGHDHLLHRNEMFFKPRAGHCVSLGSAVLSRNLSENICGLFLSMFTSSIGQHFTLDPCHVPLFPCGWNWHKLGAIACKYLFPCAVCPRSFLQQVGFRPAVRQLLLPVIRLLLSWPDILFAMGSLRASKVSWAQADNVAGCQLASAVSKSLAKQIYHNHLKSAVSAGILQVPRPDAAADADVVSCDTVASPEAPCASKVIKSKEKPIPKLIAVTYNGNTWQSIKAFVLQAEANVVFAQEHKLDGDQLVEARLWATRNGWASYWSCAHRSQVNGKSGGTLILVRKDLQSWIPKEATSNLGVFWAHGACAAVVSAGVLAQFFVCLATCTQILLPEPN